MKADAVPSKDNINAVDFDMVACCSPQLCPPSLLACVFPRCCLSFAIRMTAIKSLALLSGLCVIHICQGFAFVGQTSLKAQRGSTLRSSSRLSMAVLEVGSEEELDKTISSAGASLVVVDYSTTWCGPCKVIYPKYEELSNQFPDAIFTKVIGDSTQAATKLMKREGVRSVPSFHFWKGGKKVDQVNGANSEALETTLKEHA